MNDDTELTQTAATEVVNAPGRSEMSVENRTDSDTITGEANGLSWGARSDVGLVRGHNEDSFLVQAPLFAVCDGMGGHAAGEVASGIAVRTISEKAPQHADDILLGAAVESANAAVLEGALDGTGKPGMGCTASCVLLEKNRMAIAHVGDSRVYLLHAGTLVRITHDHSYVEELVDAGEITADEARLHPSRSIITRALGSDPDMYADHFALDIAQGDRIIVCSDGLSSMVSDKTIEELAVSSVTPQAAADTLVSAALTAGGHDNVTVVVIDVLEDGVAAVHRERGRKRIISWIAFAVVALIAMSVVVALLVRNSWYVGNNNGTVGIYRGVSGDILGISFHELASTSSVEVKDLPEAVQHQLDEGISVTNESEAHSVIERYRDQIDSDKTRAAEAAEAIKNSTGATQANPQATPATPPAPANTESGDSTPPAAAANGQQAAAQAEASVIAETASTRGGE